MGWTLQQLEPLRVFEEESASGESNERTVGESRPLVHRCFTSEMQTWSWQDLVGTGLRCPVPWVNTPSLRAAARERQAHTSSILPRQHPLSLGCCAPSPGSPSPAIHCPSQTLVLLVATPLSSPLPPPPGVSLFYL